MKFDIKGLNLKRLSSTLDWPRIPFACNISIDLISYVTPSALVEMLVTEVFLTLIFQRYIYTDQELDRR